MPVTDGVAIHAADTGLGKQFLQALLALLRTCAQVKQVFALALGTSFGHGFYVSAIVALEPLARGAHDCRVRIGRDNGLVVGEGDGAVLALQLFAAGPA